MSLDDVEVALVLAVLLAVYAAQKHVKRGVSDYRRQREGSWFSLCLFSAPTIETQNLSANNIAKKGKSSPTAKDRREPIICFILLSAQLFFVSKETCSLTVKTWQLS